MPTIRYGLIYESIASSKSGQKRVETVIANKFDEAKKEFLEEFDAHPVTQAMENGGGDDILGLDGGSLRGFIGIPEGEDPIGPLREVLEEDVVLKTKKSGVADDKKVRYKFSLAKPITAIKEVTPLEFEPSKSWALGIEDGLSGFNKFLRGAFKNPPSRSAEGLQAKNNVRSGSFPTQPYLRDLLNKLIENIQSK